MKRLGMTTKTTKYLTTSPQVTISEGLGYFIHCSTTCLTTVVSCLKVNLSTFTPPKGLSVKFSYSV